MSTQTHAAVARAINAGQRERTTGHSPGQLMPILDHSRGLGTETIPTPQLLGAAWDNAVQHGPDPPAPPRPTLLRGCCGTTGLGGTWEIPNWSPTPVLHSRWCRVPPFSHPKKRCSPDQGYSHALTPI